MERKIKKKFYRAKWGKFGARCQLNFTGGGSITMYGKNAEKLNTLSVGQMFSLRPDNPTSKR